MDPARDSRFGRACSLMITMILSAVLCPLVADGQCIDYGDYLHWEGSLGMPGCAVDVAVSGSHVYIADRYASLLVVDVSDSGPGIDAEQRAQIAAGPCTRILIRKTPDADVGAGADHL